MGCWQRRWEIASFSVFGILGFAQLTIAKSALAIPLEPITSPALTDPVSLVGDLDGGDGRKTGDRSVADDSMAQVTSVSQLTDVKPTDWAFQALQSLVERYGCIVGYPDKTYRGNRALSRYEFAAGLNACLDKIQDLLAAATADFVKKEDLEIIKRLQEQFAAELTVLRGRVDALEVRTATLEGQQFSTTTKLSGILIASVQGRTKNRADLNLRDGIRDTEDPNSSINMQYLAQLYLTSQFSPRDYLFTGLLAGNYAGRLLTNDGLLGHDFPTGGSLIVSDIHYHRLLTDNLALMVGPVGVDMLRAFRGPNRVESAATGPLSAFAQRNPILNIGFNGSGAALDWQFAKQASLQAIYISTTAASPEQRNGLFDGNSTAAVQLLLTPTKTVDLSLYYVHNYSPNGKLSLFAGDEQLTAVNPLLGRSQPLQTNAIGATVTWQISPRIELGGWGGYTNSSIPGRSGNVETINYMAFLNFPDLFKKGNLGGIYVGQPPKIVSSDLPVGNNIPDFLDTRLGRAGGQPGTTLHFEAFYRFRLTDNFSITPGVIHILDPGHTPNSDSVTIGVVRTSFFF